MTPEERVLAAINLEPYDRVPVAPHINAEYPMVHKGKTTADAYDPAKNDEGFQDTLDLFDEVGGWDGATLAGHALPVASDSLSFYRGRNALERQGYNYPGQSSRIQTTSSPQYAEEELMSVEDYDDIIELGWRGFLAKSSLEQGPDTRTGQETANIARFLTDRYLDRVRRWQERKVAVIGGDLLIDPQMALSLMRTLQQFTLDLHRIPDKVEAALNAMVDDITEDALRAMEAAGGPSKTGLPGIMMACERGSGQYYNLKIFERFVWPHIKKMCLAWIDAGYVVTLHFDTDWILNLPYLRELPAKKIICELDSAADIFKAREILEGHCSIMGDVPPAISSHGTVDDMVSYCRKLIDIVGKDTGLILSNGCAVPPDTRDENFQAMIDTAKNYYPY
jgi:uroporphyrinogen-III decarboxylase